jgi:hypothetical protein
MPDRHTPEARVLMSWHVESDTRRPTRIEDRVTGALVLRILQSGDQLVVANLSQLVDFPKNLLVLIQSLLSRGVDLYVVDLGLSAAQLAPLAKTAAEAFGPIEAEVARLEKELAQVQANAEARYENALREALTHVVTQYGLPGSVTMGVPKGVGDVRKPLADGTLGDALKKRREALGLSQSQLAEKVELDQSTISRLENNRGTHGLDAVSKFLFAEETPNAVAA